MGSFYGDFFAYMHEQSSMCVWTTGGQVVLNNNRIFNFGQITLLKKKESDISADLFK